MKTIDYPPPRPAAREAAHPPRFALPTADPEKRFFLLAEDSQNDAFLTQQAFQAAGIHDPVHTIPDGQGAMDYLRGTGNFGDRRQHPLPDVFLLDLDLPGMNGFEVLDWVRTQTPLKSLIVVILTASNREADADRAYELGANFYLTKPRTFVELVRLARCLHEWLQLHDYSVAHPAVNA